MNRDQHDCEIQGHIDVVDADGGVVCEVCSYVAPTVADVAAVATEYAMNVDEYHLEITRIDATARRQRAEARERFTARQADVVARLTAIVKAQA